MQILVLGMHRSGTSAVARILNLMGTYFTHEDAAMLPTAANPKGYWEREDVRQLNDQVISSLIMSWDNISDYDTSSLTEEVRQQVAPTVQKIIFNLESHRPWMIKDPRLCLLLPLWQPWLEVPVCVYVYRSPIQVAQSLQKREGFPLMLGIALWEKYNLYGLTYSADFPRILVSHQDLMSNPVTTVKKLYQDLLECEVQGLRLPSDKEIRAFIDPSLFHARGDTNLQNVHINHQQAWLTEAFDNGTIFQLAPLPSLSAGAVEVLQEYKNKLVTAQEMLMLRDEIGKRDQAIIQRDQTIGQRDQTIIQRDQDLAQRQAELTQTAEILAQRNVEVPRLERELQQRIIEINDLREELKVVKQTSATETARQQTQLTHYQRLVLTAETQALALKQEFNELVTAHSQVKTELLTVKEETQQQLAATQKQTIEQTQTLVDHHQRQIAALTANQHKLLHWFQALDDDVQATFDSLTWRAGNVFTRIMLALMLKKPGLTAQDHIEEIRGVVAQLKTEMSIEPPPILPRLAKSSRMGKSLETSPKTRQMVVALPKRQQIIVQPDHDPRDYPRWIQKYDTVTSKTTERMQQRIMQWDYQPLISIVMPTYNTDKRWLQLAVNSVKQQIYTRWELCIADDASTLSSVKQMLEEYATKDPRIKVIFRTENGHISAASNTALEMVSGDLVTFLDHDDMLAPTALFWVVQDLIDYPETMLWYSDEDKINENNDRHDPYFKSDWNPDLFLSHNLITHLAVYRTSLVQTLRGFREGFEGAQDYDLALRAVEIINPAQIRHIPRVLYHWRTIVGSTAVRPEEKPYALIAAQRAISEYLARRNIKANVMESPEVRGTTRVQYHLPTHSPLVSLIIPTRNELPLLHQCLESIYQKTDYLNFEILIINNASDDPATLEYFRQLEQDKRAQIIDYPYPFNYADMNNFAVTHAQGELIGLLNNDLTVINREWLSEMVSHALRPEVGAVGARLWYPNNTLQHGGVILGIGGVAGHSHKGLPRGQVGYLGRAALIQNFSAVTGACLVMRKANFLLVDGLDAENLTTAFNDVDLCLKMNQYNLRIVWTPYAELYHHESASRGYEDTPEKLARFEKERAYMKSQWPCFIAADPAYSPNLTLETQDFAYAWPPRVGN